MRRSNPWESQIVCLRNKEKGVSRRWTQSTEQYVFFFFWNNMFWKALSNKIKIMNILDLQPRDSFSLYSAHSVQCWFISLDSICSCADKIMVGEDVFYVHPYNCSYMFVIAWYSSRLLFPSNTNVLYHLLKLPFFWPNNSFSSPESFPRNWVITSYLTLNFTNFFFSFWSVLMILICCQLSTISVFVSVCLDIREQTNLSLLVNFLFFILSELWFWDHASASQSLLTLCLFLAHSVSSTSTSASNFSNKVYLVSTFSYRHIICSILCEFIHLTPKCLHNFIECFLKEVQS